MIAQVRETDARIRLISDGDVAGAIAAARIRPREWLQRWDPFAPPGVDGGRTGYAWRHVGKIWIVGRAGGRRGRFGGGVALRHRGAALHERESDPGLEIRNYGPRIAAETTVFGDEDKALSDGFRRLAGYIFGGNHGNAKIAMTAPVARQSGQKIAMTAPVSKTSSADGASVVRFFMPAGWTMDTLPEPNDDEVGLVTVPEETVAVLRFTGDRGSAAVAARTTELLDALKDTAFEPTGTPVGWFYDPPWTLPFRRRNEVAVPVARR